MFKSIFTILLLLSFSYPVFSLDDAISQRTYEYLKRVNEHIDEENWERAKKELDTFIESISSASFKKIQKFGVIEQFPNK